MPANTVSPVGRPTEIILTDEQKAIVAADADVLVIEAGAGASKTTTMVERAKFRPNRRITLVAFNTSSKLEGKDLFPANVRCMTLHGLAYKDFGVPYEQKMSREVDLAKLSNGCLEFRDAEYTVDKVETVWKTLTTYLSSADETILPSHIPEDAENVLKPGMDVLPEDESLYLDPEKVVSVASKVWERMKDLNDLSVPMVDDGYFKLYQLSKPIVGGVRYSGDCWVEELIVDEAQDLSPAQVDVIVRQVGRMKITLVGDRFQSIYKFRGAEDAMAKIPATQRLALSMSFRFGPEVAALVNPILSMRGATIPIRGFDGRSTRVGAFSLQKPYTFISRTNAGVIGEAISAATRDVKMRFIGKFGSYRFQLVLDAYNLSIGRRNLIRDATMRGYENFGYLRKAAAKNRRGQEALLVSLVDTHRSRIPELVQKVKDLSTDVASEAHLTLATVHKSKGLGFDRVKLGDDFYLAFDEGGKADERLDECLDGDGEELHLLYVAATRSKYELWTNTMLDNIAKYGVDYAHRRALDQRGNKPVQIAGYTTTTTARSSGEAYIHASSAATESQGGPRV